MTADGALWVAVPEYEFVFELGRGDGDRASRATSRARSHRRGQTCRRPGGQALTRTADTTADGSDLIFTHDWQLKVTDFGIARR